MIGPGSELARPLQRALRDLMWERCGVVRDDAGLRDGLDRIDEIRARRADVDVRPERRRLVRPGAAASTSRAGLLVAEATMRGALARRESRGCHNRTDFPELDPALQVNFHTRLADDGRLVDPWGVPVEPVPAELEPWLVAAGPSEVAGRLLE